jgi:hypothetical protein
MIKYLYNDHTVNRVMFNFTVVSFYTTDWKYPEYAQNLVDDCKRLGLEYVIESKDSTNTYVGNCNLKPFFIRDKLQELKRPVLWMDVDGSILRVPPGLAQNLDADIVAYQNQRFLDRNYVCTLLFNYTPAVLNFVDMWCQYSKNFIDDGAFDKAAKHCKQSLIIKTLPSDQIAILTNKENLVSDKICFVQRLSSSDLKWQYKNKVEGRS